MSLSLFMQKTHDVFKKTEGIARIWLKTLLVTALYAGAAFLLFRNAAGAAPGGASLSLRYDTPLTPQQVAAAKLALGNPALTVNFYPAFWLAMPETAISAGRGEVKTPAIFVDGDMQGVYPAAFTQGGYPSPAEERGLALSEGLAWNLLGSAVAVGAEIEWHGAAYTVRGVFKGSQPMLLAQVDAANTWVAGFSGVELYGLPGEEDPRAAAAAFASGPAALGVPSQIVNARTLPEILLAMAWAPTLALALWFAARLLLGLRRANFWLQQGVWLCLLFALAVGLPRLLATLPGWVIPNQWSNLEHWREFFQQIGARLTAWLSMKPSPGEVLLKQRLIWQTALLFPALGALGAVWRRWGGHIK
jgi:hypothetical protein